MKIPIDDSPYYVFVALCIVVIVVSLIKIAIFMKILNVFANENIECFREYFAVGYRAPDPTVAFLKVLARVRTKNKPS